MRSPVESGRLQQRLTDHLVVADGTTHAHGNLRLTDERGAGPRFCGAPLEQVSL